MKKIIILLISLLIITNLQAEDNLKFFVKKALKNNFQLNAERKSFESAKQNKNISRSEFLPSVTLSGDQKSSTSTNRTNQNGAALSDSNLDTERKAIEFRVNNQQNEVLRNNNIYEELKIKIPPMREKSYSLNTELDKIIAMMQQQGVDINLSPRASSTTSTAYGLIFPELVANKILTVNSSGNALEFSQSITDVSTVAAIASDITTVSGIASNVTAVAGNATNINAVANDATDIGAVAAKATEIGRLGTADAVADMAILATDAIVADMAILGTDAIVADMAILGSDATVADMAILATNDVVADMAILATNDVVADRNTLGTSDVVSDMNTLGTSDVVSDMNTLASSSNVTNMNTLAGISSNITTVAGISSNVTTVASNNSNVTTVASNITDVNSFANTYRIGSSDPSSSLNEGDLFYNSTSNVLKFYNGSAWVAISADTDSLVKVSSNDTTAGFLNGKLVASTGISFTEGNNGGNETLTIANTGATLDDATALAIALG